MVKHTLFLYKIVKHSNEQNKFCKIGREAGERVMGSGGAGE